MKSGELFMRFGIKSISMDDISRQLAISKKTIYQYFSDKEELIIQYIKSYLEQQKKDILNIKKDSRNVIDEMIKSTTFMKDNLGQINPTMIYDLKKYHSKAWKIFTDFKEDFLEKLIKQALSEGMNDGYFRKDLDMEITARYRLEQLEMGFNYDIFPSTRFNHAKVQIELFEQFMYGICTLKGHKLINKYKQIKEDED